MYDIFDLRLEISGAVILDLNPRSNSNNMLNLSYLVLGICGVFGLD